MGQAARSPFREKGTEGKAEEEGGGEAGGGGGSPLCFSVERKKYCVETSNYNYEDS